MEFLCTIICHNGWLCKSRSLLLVVFVDEDLWKKYVPQPVQVRTDNIYDYYDILEELGR